MRQIDLSGIDLNLLVALQALLLERNVTRAGRRCGLTQSSMSHNLARLRELFGDALLVRVGRGMEPTPRAQSLQAPLERMLEGISALLHTSESFEPATSTRVFTIASPDLLAAVLPELLAVLSCEAPQLRLEHQLVLRDVVPHLLEGNTDVGLAPPGAEASGVMQRTLGAVGWGVFGRADHPALRRRLKLETWLAHSHVVVGGLTRGMGLVDGALRKENLSRKVGLTVSSFSLIPFALMRSDLLFTAPLELFAPLAAPLGLTYRSVPIDLGRVPVVLYWTERFHGDPGHRWFREHVATTVSRLLAPARTR